MKAQYEIRTKKTFSEAVSAVYDSVQLFNFTVISEFDVKTKLEQSNLTFSNPFTIIEICNAKRAKDILDQNLLIGYFLPCKVVVYEKEKQVYIGMLNPTALVHLVESTNLIGIATDIENDLRKAIDLAAI